jgi:tetratricopeptide (TPR) repeat protein
MRLGLASLLAISIAFGGVAATAQAYERREPASMTATRALQKARVAARKGDHSGAIASFDKVLLLEPDFASVITERAFSREALGDLSGAQDDYREAARLEPDQANAWSHVAWIEALRGGDLDQALADSEKAVALGATNDAVSTRGFVRYRRGEYVQALSDHNAVLAKHPRAASLLFMRGVIKRRLDQGAEGDADIARAVKIDSSVEALWARRGVTP